MLIAAWFNYVAAIVVIQRLAGQSGTLISLLIIVRMLPSLFLFPAAGVVADRQACCPIMTTFWRNLTCCRDVIQWAAGSCTALADCRFPRENVLITSNIAAGVFVSCLAFIKSTEHLW